ncbi:hypothetical protein WG906_08335 [Pedobacter sp. P351]|uniref:hypothetical protein n=1 Tax=Pedobacter superstes TaxID=3133441 RepID=UPI0030B05518
MKNLKRIAKITFQNSTIKKGFIISAIVGSFLNLINQGNLFFTNQLPEVSIMKIGLTYITPFVVSVYSITSTKLKQDYTMNKQNQI